MTPTTTVAQTSPRDPAWVLVARKDGPRGWHLIKAVAEFGTVVTVCGLKGSKLFDTSPLIVRCEACQAVDGVS